MEIFDDLPRAEKGESAQSRLSAAFGDELAAQMPPLKPTGEGSSVLRPPEIKPPVVIPPKTELPPPKTELPPPKTELPPPKTEAPKVEDARSAKVKDVVDTLKDKDAPMDKMIKKIETSFRNEDNKETMEELSRRINDGLKGSGVSLDLHAFRNHKVNMAVSIQGIGRPYDIFVGPGQKPKR